MSEKTAKAVILLSGGLDSTTCLAIAKKQGYDCYALSINYGQKQCIELAAARKIAAVFQVKKHHVVTLSIGEFGGSALTDKNMIIPAFRSSENKLTVIPTTYVPARNTIFLSVALGFAETVDADAIFIGANAVDYSGYPDCRPEYFEAFQIMANIATKSAVCGKKIKIETPILHLSKADIIALGTTLGVDYGLTISCYQANESGLACGICDACAFRKMGFEKNNMVDPTRYA
ncbi:MAG: hypothetical protein ACD_42C00499G0004 [uncultured bacterium]|nr:MAG: hypothetical protein ACD_42C00499G0004 [uncultured bacterium]OGT34620.1 MAG: 7-cyano-7-deazaguanine synthase QueC [Gammaproteobacteria bacterium RIFCSPHIGHO2_02_FULL_39_13]OGT50041.1 MAG: 7-cyano-7-deazaguanine synthase QueC [Gammaproteobacteria bacterium RIFCSPHIGHO2_12_FULL_39_24]